MEHNVDINSVDCVAKVTDFGSITYHNICTGAVHTVSWGTMDYIGIGIILTLALLFLAMLTGMLLAIISHWY